MAWSYQPDKGFGELQLEHNQTSDSNKNLTGLLPLPVNGRLKDDAVFWIQVGAAAPLKVTLQAASTATNTSVTQLRNQLITALRTANVDAAADIAAAGTNKVGVTVTSDGRINLHSAAGLKGHSRSGLWLVH